MHQRCGAALIGGLILMGATTALRAQATGPETVPGEVLVAMRPAAFSGHFLRAMASNLGEVTGGQRALHTVRLRLGQGVRLTDALSRLRQRGYVLYAEPNYVTHVLATPNDKYYADHQYAPQITQTDRAWSIWTPHAQAIVAIVDTGVEAAHPDLTNKIDRDAQGNVIGYDFVHDRAGAEDDNGHGTHCAGIAAAQADNGAGIAGVAGWDGLTGDTDTESVKIMPVKVMDSSGAGSHAAIADGILWAADHGARVISLSLGGPQDSQTLESAIAYAWNKGCLVVAAAGNSASTAPSYPAACAHVLAVAATDSTDTLAPYSNFGPSVKVAAPGSDIASTWLKDQYMMASGTSMACPFVAGEAALLWSDVPGLSNEKLENLLTSNVDPVATFQGDALPPGVGRVNVYKALAAAIGTPPTPAPTSPPAPPAPAADPVASAKFDPGTVKGGLPAHLTVTLAAPAPSEGTVVTLADSAKAILALPTQFTIPAGKIGVVFTAVSAPVAQTTSITVTASSGDVSKTATLTVLPPAVRTFTLSPAQVTGGVSVTGTLVLDGPAPNGFVVPLTSSAASVTVPSRIGFRIGSASVSFPINTRSVTTAATVTLTVGGSVPKTTILRVTPAVRRR